MEDSNRMSLSIDNSQENLQSQIKLYGRYACLSIGVFLLFVGSCLAIAVFVHLWGLVTAPDNLAKSLNVVYKMIDGNKFDIPAGNRVLPLGKFVGLSVLLFLYYFCLRIPLLIITSGRELLKWTFESNESTE